MRNDFERLQLLVGRIEEFLLSFHRLHSANTVVDFLQLSSTIDRTELQIFYAEDGYLEVAVAVSAAWLKSEGFFESTDALIALVEEVSHFHTLVGCEAKQQKISRLDLEVQGEVDKVVFILDQYRKGGLELNAANFSRLVKDIIHSPKIVSENKMLYEKAGYLAEKTLDECLARVAKYSEHPSLEDLRPWLRRRHPGKAA